MPASRETPVSVPFAIDPRYGLILIAVRVGSSPGRLLTMFINSSAAVSGISRAAWEELLVMELTGASRNATG